MESGKPLLVNFKSAGCGPCEEFERITLNDAVVITYAARFEAVRVNALKEPMLATRYLVSTFPCVKFLDADGTVVYDTRGLVPPKEFVAVMERALQGHAALRRARQAIAEAGEQPSPEAALAIARDLAFAWQFASAAVWAERALTVEDESKRAEALFIRGTSLVEIGEPVPAIQALMQYLRMTSRGENAWRARVALGYAWVQTGENEKGAELLRAVVEAEDAPISAREKARSLLRWAGSGA